MPLGDTYIYPKAQVLGIMKIKIKGPIIIELSEINITDKDLEDIKAVFNQVVPLMLSGAFPSKVSAPSKKRFSVEP